MNINEIFKSIQGEGPYSGSPCTFIRTTGCNLRCSYCDTTYAYEEGQELTVDEIMDKVMALGCSLVEITGGEPLLQGEVHALVERLLEERVEVLLETNGSLDLSFLDPRVIKIVDIKCPQSLMSQWVNWTNLALLGSMDHVKFIIQVREDYDWAKGVIDLYGLSHRLTVWMGVAFGMLEPGELARWILQDQLKVRLQLQIHKYIWSEGLRGV